MEELTKVLFVCHGNICRSPLAEFVFRDMVSRAGLSDRIECASCATSTEHIGQAPDPRAQVQLANHGILCSGKTARRLTDSDFSEYDYILGMDHRNLEYIDNVAPPDTKAHIGLLKDYSTGGDVADPWYTGDFNTTYVDVEKACRGLLDSFREGCR